MKLHCYFIALVMFSLCGGCISGESKTQNQKIYYFNLKNFFEAEVLRLNIENPAVYKSVYHNKQSQKKKVEINDWATELSLFTESDINKTAFKNSYHTDSAATKIVYTAKNKDLKTQRITIYLQNYKPVYVHIINYQKNYLFKSLENLIYYTKKAYVIKKKQKPLFGDTETYNVKGIF